MSYYLVRWRDDDNKIKSRVFNNSYFADDYYVDLERRGYRVDVIREITEAEARLVFTREMGSK